MYSQHQPEGLKPITPPGSGRTEGHIIPEGARTNYRQRGFALQLRRRRHRDNGDSCAVSQHLGRDRLALFLRDDADQVGRGRRDFTVEVSDQELVLEFDLQAIAIAEAFDSDTAARKTLGRAALDIGDFAAEDDTPVQNFSDHRWHLIFAGLRFDDSRAQMMRQAERVMYAGRFDLSAAHDGASQAGARAHADGDVARDLLGPDIADSSGHNGGVVGGVDHCQRRGGGAGVEEESRHLYFGIGAAHAVAIHRWDAGLQAANQRLHRIGAADLGDSHGIETPADMLFQQPHGPHHLSAFGQFLDADRGRADAADYTAERVIG